jgi:hypothetical protein
LVHTYIASTKHKAKEIRLKEVNIFNEAKYAISYQINISGKPN